jgi:hypothetical protein
MTANRKKTAKPKKREPKLITLATWNRRAPLPTSPVPAPVGRSAESLAQRIGEHIRWEDVAPHQWTRERWAQFFDEAGDVIRNTEPPPAPPSDGGQTPAERILAARFKQDEADAEIHAVAKQYVEGFHFMDHSVSTFWTCEQSTIGYCVFRLDEKGRKQECIYCGGPVERK